MAELLRERGATLPGEPDQNTLFRQKIRDGHLWPEVRFLPQSLQTLALNLLVYDPKDRWDAEKVLAYLTSSKGGPPDKYAVLAPVDVDPKAAFRTSREFVRYAIDRIKNGEPEWIFENFPSDSSAIGKWIKQHAFNDVRDEYVKAVESRIRGLAEADTPSTATRAWEACFILDPHYPLRLSNAMIENWSDLVQALELEKAWDPAMTSDLIRFTKRFADEPRGWLEIWLAGTQSAPAFQLEAFIDAKRDAALISTANERLGRRLDAIKQWGDGHQHLLGESSSDVVARLIVYGLLFSIRMNDGLMIRQIGGTRHWEALGANAAPVRLVASHDVGRWALAHIELADEVRRGGVLGMWIDSRQDYVPDEPVKGFGLLSVMGMPVHDELLTLVLAIEMLPVNLSVDEVSLLERTGRDVLTRVSVDGRLFKWTDAAFIDDILSHLTARETRRFVQRVKACLSLVDGWQGVFTTTTTDKEGVCLGSWLLHYSLFPMDPITVVDASDLKQEILDPMALGQWMARNIHHADELRMTGLLSLWCFAQHGFPEGDADATETLWGAAYAKATPDLTITTRMAGVLAEGGIDLLLQMDIAIDSLPIEKYLLSSETWSETATVVFPVLELPQVSFRGFRTMTVCLQNQKALGWMQGCLEIINTEGSGFGIPRHRQDLNDPKLGSNRTSKRRIETEEERPNNRLAFSGNSCLAEVQLSGEAPRAYDVFAAYLQVTYNHQGVRDVIVQVPMRFAVILDHRREWRNAVFCAVCGALIFGYAGWLLETVYLRSAMCMDAGGELLPMAEDSSLVGMDGVSIWIGGWTTGSTQNLRPTGPIAGPDGAPVAQYYQQGFLGIFFIVSFFVAIVLSLRWRRYCAPKARPNQS
jgi:hypothetical protein